MSREQRENTNFDSRERNGSNDLDESRENDLSDVGEDVAEIAHVVDLLLTDSKSSQRESLRSVSERIDLVAEIDERSIVLGVIEDGGELVRQLLDVLLPNVVRVDEFSSLVHEVVESTRGAGGGDEGGIVNGATDESIDLVEEFRNFVVRTEIDDELVEGVEERSEVADEGLDYISEEGGGSLDLFVRLDFGR